MFILQDDFDSLRPLCYPGTDVFLLCFSVVSPTSFHNVTEKWLPELRRHNPNVPVVLVGTQCDLRNDVKVLIDLAKYREQPVPESDARRVAQQTGCCAYLECSALTQTNLKEVFDSAILSALAVANNNFVGKSKKLSPLDFHWSKSKSKPHKKKTGWKRLCCFSWGVHKVVHMSYPSGIRGSTSNMVFCIYLYIMWSGWKSQHFGVFTIGTWTWRKAACKMFSPNMIALTNISWLLIG